MPLIPEGRPFFAGDRQRLRVGRYDRPIAEVISANRLKSRPIAAQQADRGAPAPRASRGPARDSATRVITPANKRAVRRPCSPAQGHHHDEVGQAGAHEHRVPVVPVFGTMPRNHDGGSERMYGADSEHAPRSRCGSPICWRRLLPSPPHVNDLIQPPRPAHAHAFPIPNSSTDILTALQRRTLRAAAWRRVGCGWNRCSDARMVVYDSSDSGCQARPAIVSSRTVQPGHTAHCCRGR